MKPVCLRVLKAPALVLLAAGCGDAVGLAPIDGPEQTLVASPVLLECPVSRTSTVSRLIGTPGGVLDVDHHRIVVPIGALPSPTDVRLTVPASNYLEVQASAPGLQRPLAAPATITIDYSRCADHEIEGRALSVWRLDPVTKAPIEEVGGVDDRESRSITFQATQFSGFAIAE